MQINVNDVSYIYDPKDPSSSNALNNITLTINSGDFVGVVGKTGSGKSTLVQTFNALILPTSGETIIDDFIVTGDKKRRKAELKKANKEIREKNLKKFYLLKKIVGMVFQFPEYQLFSESVLKDVMFGPKNFGLNEKDAKDISIKTLKSVGINEDYFERSPFELSGGEKRRVAIAGILASSPDILVLDEPTAGLDPSGKIEIMNLIKKYHESGKTIVVVTHDMDIVMNYCKKVVILNDSRLIEITDPKSLFNEKDVSKYSLEMPTLYKFKNILKNKGFAGNLDDIYDINSLVNRIMETKHE